LVAAHVHFGALIVGQLAPIKIGFDHLAIGVTSLIGTGNEV
jgi:hypothetical protein